mgnify:CR=1 FL=1
MVGDGITVALVGILLGEAAIESRNFFQLPVTFLYPPSKGQLSVQDWLLLLYQDSRYLSFIILRIFCKLFCQNALHFSIQRFCPVIAARDGVNGAADLTL